MSREGVEGGGKGLGAWGKAAVASGAIAIFAVARVASADPEADADRAFQLAEQHAVAGDPKAIEELEALGSARPITRWTDDAWMEAGRLAKRVGQAERARKDFEQAIAVTTDDQLARRARGELARLVAATGEHGEWAQVAVQHEQLVEQLAAGGDPKPALAQLEALVDGNRGYPRAAAAMLAIAAGWDRDGNGERALAWYRRARDAAQGTERTHVVAEYVRALIRHGDFDDARSEIDGLASNDALMREVAQELRDELHAAELRRDLCWAAFALLLALVAAAVWSLRRLERSWRAASKRLIRPPAEAIYFVPIAIVLIVVAQTGNPFAARAVRTIALGGAVVAWLSGATLDAVRALRGRVGAPRAIGQGLLAVLAIAAIAYLAVDHDHLIDLVIGTWREGPALR